MLAATAALLATAAPDADRALLQAFAVPCSQVESWDKMVKGAAKGGWLPMEESAEPRIAALSEKGRKAMEPGEKLTGATFRRMHQGRAIHLILSRVTMESGIWANGCRVYDLDAPQPLDLAKVRKWIGKKPTSEQLLGDGLTKHLWEPWVSGRSFEVNYVPAAHPVGRTFGVSGVVLVSSAIGGF